MPRPTAAEKIRLVKSQLGRGVGVRFIHATRRDIALTADGDSAVLDDRDNLLPSADFYRLLSTFDLHEPIEELRQGARREVWAPDLVKPSQHSFISPSVLAGDPCISYTRIPTSAIYALRVERLLPLRAIVELYPGVTTAAAGDVTTLEARLRGVDTSVAA